MPYEHIDDETITSLVHRFYAKVRQDPQIGPIFNDTIEEWGPHLATMVDFWSSVMLTTGRYKGNPMGKHMRLSGIRPESFERWLTLFEATAGELFVPALAAGFVEKARRIAESLQLGLFYRPRDFAVVPPPRV